MLDDNGMRCTGPADYLTPLRTRIGRLVIRIRSNALTAFAKEPVGMAVVYGVCCGAITNSGLGFWAGTLIAYLIRRAIRPDIAMSGDD